MTGRYERSARFWLHAYPQRWREAHGDEALAVLLDLAPPVPDGGCPPRGIGAREAWGLVRSGWGLRWREHPPLGRWLLYRMLDVRLPARYWWWVADDIHGALYAWRNGAFNAVLLLQITYGLPLFGLLLGDEYVVHLPTWFFPTWLFVAVVLGTAFRRQQVARSWRKHVLEGNIPVEVPRAPSPADGGRTQRAEGDRAR